jgi:hypothetical protein
MTTEDATIAGVAPTRSRSLLAVAGAACAATIAVAALMVTPAQAGRWIVGGMFDDVRFVPVQFLRFLAEPGEGQMTIRCDQKAGLWMDAGVEGNGVVPPDLERGGAIEVSFTFIEPNGPVTINVVGKLMVRLDGAVLAAIGGPAALPLGPALLGPAERIDITIAGTVRSVPLTEAREDLMALADRCQAWPR